VKARCALRTSIQEKVKEQKIIDISDACKSTEQKYLLEGCVHMTD
jgi:hypothetical protein